MRRYFLVAYTVMPIYWLFACDICGCFMGILPYDNQSSISFFHRYRIFNGYYSMHQKGVFIPSGVYRVMHGNHGTAPSTSVDTIKKYLSSDYEAYKVYELRGKWFIHHRIEIDAIVPFTEIKARQDTIKIKHFGLSDPTFLLGYHLIKKIYEEKIQYRLILYGGIKLPSGNYYAKDDYGNRIPLLLQPGTGSVDVMTGFTGVMGYKKIGMMMNAFYKMNGKNYYGEKIANSLTANAIMFFKFKYKNWMFVPSWQNYYEYTKGLYVDKQYVSGTLMNVWLSGIGMDVNYKNIQLNMGWQWKVYEQRTSEDQLKNKGRFYVGLTYNFNQRKYLFN
jgi:hypothetical protein